MRMLHSQQKFEAYIQSLDLKEPMRIGVHAHDGFDLLYITEGETHILIRDNRYTAVAGDLAVYYPGEYHQEEIAPGKFSYICLRFQKKFVDPQLKFPAQSELEPVFNLPWKDRFRALFEQIVIEHGGVDSFNQLLVGTYLAQLVILLGRALSFCKESLPSETHERELRISTILDLIHARVDLDLSLKDLAGEVYMSESHFSHVFKDVMGVPPKRYVISAKMEKARELLLMSNQPLSDIALSLGYDEPAYFSRLFKKQWGISPAEFRNSGKGKKIQ